MADGWADVAVGAVVFTFPWVELYTDPLRVMVAWSTPDDGRSTSREPLTWPTVNARPKGFTAYDSPEGGLQGFTGTVTLTERFVPGDTLEIPAGGLVVTV